MALVEPPEGYLYRQPLSQAVFEDALYDESYNGPPQETYNQWAYFVRDLPGRWEEEGHPAYDILFKGSASVITDPETGQRREVSLTGDGQGIVVQAWETYLVGGRFNT